MPIHSRILENGARNARVLVTGVLECDVGPVEIIDLENFNCRAIKLESAVWIVQEKLVVRLWWGIGDPPPNSIPACPEVDIKNLIFVMESRNAVRFDHGLDSPKANEKWDRKIWLDTGNFTSNELSPKHFTFVLDFDKQ